MNIIPKNGPAINQLPNAKSDSRARAVAAFMGNEAAQQAAAAPAPAQETPVANPTSVQPEELGALRQSTSEKQTQSDSTDSTSSTPAATEGEKKAEDPLSTQYANLARKEKALRAKITAQEAATKAREAAIAAREEAIKAKEAEYQANYVPKSRLKEDYLGVMSEVGVDYNEITKGILDPQSRPDPRVNAEIKRLEARLEAQIQERETERKATQERQTNEYKAAVDRIRNQATQLVNSNESFELIKEADGINDVVELIEKTFKEDNIMLTVEEAAKEVEEYYFEKIYKAAKAKKIREKLAQEAASNATAQTASTKPSDPPKQQPMKTLTNAVNSSSKPMSARDRAILAFQNKLQK